MNKSESIKELAVAMAKAQAEVENAIKGSTNPHFKSKYADLAEIINTVRPVFSKHGLSIMQSPSHEGDTVSVETMIIHASGEWLSGQASCKVTKNDAQGVGSAITYLRRYSMAAFACIAQEDDDGNGAVGKTVEVKKLTQEQLSRIVELIDTTGSDTAKFCIAFKIKTIEELPVDKFEQAKKMLEEKLSKMQ